MEIPFVLVERRDGRLAYSIPIWFRVIAALPAIVVAIAFIADGEAPNLVGWTVFAILALAALYDESWSFDAARGLVEHRAGLLFAAKRRELELARVARVRVSPFVRGSLPGSEEERREGERILSGAPELRFEPGRRLSPRGKAYLQLSLEAEDGTRWLLDSAAARRRDAILWTASRIASYCGKPLEKG